MKYYENAEFNRFVLDATLAQLNLEDFQGQLVEGVPYFGPAVRVNRYSLQRSVEAFKNIKVRWLPWYNDFLIMPSNSLSSDCGSWKPIASS
jgi:hypothetical protein